MDSNEERVLVFVDADRICRFCLRSDGALTEIFDETRDPQILAQLLSFANIRIAPDENLPAKVCHRCRYMIETCCEFRRMVLRSHEALSQTERESKEPSVELDRDSATETRPGSYPSLRVAQKLKLCFLCLQKCRDEADLRAHVDEHVAGTGLEPYYAFGDRDIVCNACDRFFARRFEFLIHQREHLDLKPFRCDYEGCARSFHSKSALRHHSSNHADKNFICSVCAVGFKRKSDLKGHEVIHEDDGVSYECPVCKLVCKNRNTKAAHLKKHHKKPTFRCGSCPKEYYSRSELRRHEYIHMPDKRFRCDRCTYAYYSKSALARHIKSQHCDESENEPAKKCPLCWQTHPLISFKTCMRRLKDSSRELSYRCENCNKEYLEESCLRKHAECCLSEMTLLEDCADKEIPNIDEKFNFLHYKEDLIQIEMNKDKI